MVFHLNGFLVAVTSSCVAHFLAYNIDFILMSPLRIDDLRLGIILIKSICHIIVQCSYESVLILNPKSRLVPKVSYKNPSCNNRVFQRLGYVGLGQQLLYIKIHVKTNLSTERGTGWGCHQVCLEGFISPPVVGWKMFPKAILWICKFHLFRKNVFSSVVKDLEENPRLS